MVVTALSFATRSRASSSSMKSWMRRQLSHSQHLGGNSQRSIRTTTALRSFAASTVVENKDNSSTSTSTSLSIPTFPPPPLRAYPRQYTSFHEVPSHIPRPSYADSGQLPLNFLLDAINIHDETTIPLMRAAAQLARTALDVVLEHAQPGVTTEELDLICHNYLIEQGGAYPSPLNYAGFPKSLCSSINEVICHGIPDSRPLQYGDVVAFDVSCFLDGVHGDNCATIIVGDYESPEAVKNVKAIDSRDHWEKPNSEEIPSKDWRGVPYKSLDSMTSSLSEPEHFRQARRLVRAAREALYAGINTCRPGSCLSDIGSAIHDVADKYGYESVEKYRGHGIGHEFHCAPFVKHYRNYDRLKLSKGMVFTIEPMLVMGSQYCFEWNDAWTVATQDGSLSAQFEHTVLITDDGVEILTIPMERS